jgi:hypothetical protein
MIESLKSFNKRIKPYHRKCLTDSNINVTILCLNCKIKVVQKKRDFKALTHRCRNCLRLKVMNKFKILAKKRNYSLVRFKPQFYTIKCNKCSVEKNVPAGSSFILSCKLCVENKKKQKLIERPPSPLAVKNVKLRGGKIIKKEVINKPAKDRTNGYNYVYLTIVCANNHKFTTNEHSIKIGRYCRECSTGMAESIFRLALNTFTDYKFFSTYIKHGPNSRDKYQLDAFSPDLKLNIEVHGVQHYKFHKFFHKDNADFLRNKKHDRKKVRFLAKNGIACYSVTDKEVVKAIREGTIKALVLHYLKMTGNESLIPANFSSRVLDLRDFFKNRTFADSIISIKKKYPGQNIWDLIEYKKRDEIRKNRKTKSGDGYKLIQK